MLLDLPVKAPDHLRVEASNVLRRAALAGDVSPDVAALAHTDLARLAVELFPFAPFATRVWELHENVTSYDACHVALAESLDADLATLDRRLTRAPGLRCSFRSPD